MLAFARRQQLRPEAVDIAKLVNSMIEMLRRSVGPAIHIATDFERGLAPIRVDPNQLELALLNLAVNARDAMPVGGEVTITACREQVGPGEVKGLGPGEYVRIGFGDTGHGMDETTLRRATEPFFTTKGPGHGTGLGLSMVDGLVAQSGGVLRIDSRPTIGTTVELWLPVSAAGDGHVPEPSGVLLRAGASRSFRVLVVDDDAMVASGTAAMIEDLGHSVIQAESASRALQLLSTRPRVDVVITDYAMPGMTGGELATEIRRVRPELPVVIATGYSDAPAELGLPRLNKPYRQQDLVVLFATLFDPLPVAPPAALDTAPDPSPPPAPLPPALSISRPPPGGASESRGILGN
jgi:CheY-like chemotaxis protein